MTQHSEIAPRGGPGQLVGGAVTAVLVGTIVSGITFELASDDPSGYLALIPLGSPLVVAAGLRVYRPRWAKFARGMVVGTVIWVFAGMCGAVLKG